ncbi:hypothetical protein LPUS_03411 [Lasallia pustulata]|uniref:Uncharacterized protein n=1 Tax=Lasallia pustulata TaxID=136370 RepID=A0A1W5CV19_9LECA|nr:hypothetical protein LPUS_03411 [Lasallia pustulata]
MLTKRIAFAERSPIPIRYNDVGGQGLNQTTARLDPGDAYDTLGGHSIPGLSNYGRGVNVSARTRLTNPTQVTHGHQEICSRLPSGGGQTLIPAWVVVPPCEHTTVVSNEQFYLLQNRMILPGEGPTHEATSLYSLDGAFPSLNGAGLATTGPTVPFSGYAAASYQPLAENHVSPEASAFMQDNAQSETLADGNPVSMPSSSCIPQSTSLPQSSPSLCTGFSSSRFVADDFLFQQQCFAVGQENFSVRNQPELSNQRELLQNRISLNGETDEAFSSSINIVPHLDASNGSLSRVQTVFNGEQLPQLENVDLVANAQKPQKLGDYGVKRANKASTTARSSRGLRHTTRIRSKTVKPSQFRERQIRGIQTIDQATTRLLLDPESGELQGHRKDVLISSRHDWQLLHTRELDLTQDMGSILKVTVSRYDPIPGDKTAYEWEAKNGIHRIKMPPYCITHVEEAKLCMFRYAKESRLSYLENTLDSSNKILWDTFNIALRSGNFMVQKALELWVTNRMIERTWRLCGDDTLGLEPVSDKTSPWADTVPVTPLMDQQLDQIVIQWLLKPLRKPILTNLKRFIKEKAKENWFEIHLTIFILLHNSEVHLAHARQFAQRYGMSGRYGPYGKYIEAENQFHTARTILAHFHHVCRGSIPLTLDWNSTNSLQHTKLDKEQIEYLVRLKEHISENEGMMLALRANNNYEIDLYWCHQMFFAGWVPGQGHIEELPSETTNT